MPPNKKEQILSAASECFARYGYKKTTLDDIGKKIGLNKASIYYYFKNKEEIFTTIVLNEFKQFITKLQQDIAKDMDCDQKILLYFEEKHHFWSQKAKILPLITEIEPEEVQLLMASGIEIYSEIEKGEKSFLADILQNCIKNGHIKDCNVEKMSGFMFALADGVKNNYMGFNTNKKLTSTDYENLIKDTRTALTIFLNGLK